MAQMTDDAKNMMRSLIEDFRDAACINTQNYAGPERQEAIRDFLQSDTWLKLDAAEQEKIAAARQPVGSVARHFSSGPIN